MQSPAWSAATKPCTTTWTPRRNRLDQYTDVLQEYFLPPEQLAALLTRAADVIGGHDAVLLRASIRSVNAEDVALKHAKGHRLSVVLYLTQRVSTAGVDDMGTSPAPSSTSHCRGGSFYLPLPAARHPLPALAGLSRGRTSSSP